MFILVLLSLFILHLVEARVSTPCLETDRYTEEANGKRTLIPHEGGCMFKDKRCDQYGYSYGCLKKTDTDGKRYCWRQCAPKKKSWCYTLYKKVHDNKKSHLNKGHRDQEKVTDIKNTHMSKGHRDDVEDKQWKAIRTKSKVACVRDDECIGSAGKHREESCLRTKVGWVGKHTKPQCFQG